jgi:hypothetical protein
MELWELAVKEAEWQDVVLMMLNTLQVIALAAIGAWVTVSDVRRNRKK